jgi:hypothetical protein
MQSNSPLIPTGGKINCGFFNMLFKNYRSHKVKQAAVGLHDCSRSSRLSGGEPKAETEAKHELGSMVFALL